MCPGKVNRQIHCKSFVSRGEDENSKPTISGYRSVNARSKNKKLVSAARAAAAAAAAL
jgi:hypothetical protein